MNLMEIKEHKCKSLLKFAIPSTIAMLLQTVITVTDGYFTGNYVGEDALAAINLGLPMLLFYLGTGLCVGVGGSVICGKLLGAKENGRASKVFSQTMATVFAIGIGISLVFCALFVPMMNLLGADGALAQYFSAYYQVMLISYPLMIAGTTLGIFIRIDGRPQFCMQVSILSCLLNAALDYILMDAYAMGILGSALATLAVHGFAVVVQLCYFLKSEGFGFCRFNFDRKINAEMMQNGSSEFIDEMAGAISIFAFNYVLLKYVGVDGVVAFSVLGFAVYGYTMIVLGFGQGLTPLISFLWGAEEKEAVMDLRKITNRILFLIGVLFSVVFISFSDSYAGIFGCSDEVVRMLLNGFMFFSVAFLTMGYNIINSMYFTGCGDAKSSAIIASLRGLVLLLIFTFIFPALWGMDGVWMVTPLTEVLTAVVSFQLIRKQKRILENGDTSCARKTQFQFGAK